MKIKSVLGFIVFLLISASLCAQDQNLRVSHQGVTTIPLKLSYQGVLDSAGTHLTGSRTITFRLYDVPINGSPIWSETQDVQVFNGKFNVLLGGVELFDTLSFSQPYWLEVTVNESTLDERIELSSSAYSFNTARIQGKLVSSNSPSTGQVLKWSGLEWAPGTDATGGGGDITEVRSGNGLTGGPINSSNPSGEISIANGGIVNEYIAPSTISLSKISGSGAGSGQIIKYNGSSVVWANDEEGTLSLPYSASVSALFGFQVQNSRSDGTAILGYASTSTGNNFGISGLTLSATGKAVYGEAAASTGFNYGVYGRSSSASGTGVFGIATAGSGNTFGVVGQASASVNGYGVYSIGRTGASGTKSFQIDHPLDPQNKYLNHFCTEGPEPYLIYRGNVVLNETGSAWVVLPDYFEAINREYHYSLTPVGGAAPQLHVAQKINNNRFLIAGGSQGIEVSWTVTGIRNDPFVRNNPLQDIQEKPIEFKGSYLHPEFFNQPQDQHQFHRTLRLNN